MKIVIHVDDTVWGDAWGDWSDALPDDKRWPARSGSMAAHRKVVQQRLRQAVGCAVEAIRFIEDEVEDDDDFEDEGDE